MIPFFWPVNITVTIHILICAVNGVATICFLIWPVIVTGTIHILIWSFKVIGTSYSAFYSKSHNPYSYLACLCYSHSSSIIIGLMPLKLMTIGLVVNSQFVVGGGGGYRRIRGLLNFTGSWVT